MHMHQLPNNEISLTQITFEP